MVCVLSFLLGLYLLIVQLGKNRTIDFPLSQKTILGVEKLYRFASRGNTPPEVTSDAYKVMIPPIWTTQKQSAALYADFVRQRQTQLKLLSSKYLTVIPDREVYYRHQLIKLIAFPEKGLERSVLYAVLYKNGNIIQCGGMRSIVPFKREGALLVGRMNPGFNPKPGIYTAAIFAKGIIGRVYTVTIRIKSRIPRSLQSGFSVMTMESAIPMRYQRVKGPLGKIGSWQKLLKWADFLTADAFWILGSQASGNDRGISPKNPFCKDTLKNIDLLGKAAKRRGIRFGSYIISFYTPHGGHHKAGYIPSMKYIGQGKFLPSLHTSLASRRRIADLTAFAIAMQRKKHVDFIGFDFIRTGHSDGFELVDHVVRDMHIPVPEIWGNLTKQRRMAWFASQILDKRDRKTIDAWRWWRAHHVATLIGSIIRNGRITKPVWVYTLGWEHGKQHGQDPYMMIDAGCALDAAMLYEANGRQFDGMEKQWKQYLDSKQVNLFTGNCVDWKLNKRIGVHPIVEFYRRSIRGLTKFSYNKIAAGIFWHDVARAVWGRTGGNSGSEWGIVGASAATTARFLSGRHSLKVSLKIHRRYPFQMTCRIRNVSHKPVLNITVSAIPVRFLPGLTYKKIIPRIQPGSVVTNMISLPNPVFTENVHVAGVRVSHYNEKDAVSHIFIRK